MVSLQIRQSFDRIDERLHAFMTLIGGLVGGKQLVDQYSAMKRHTFALGRRQSDAQVFLL